MKNKIITLLISTVLFLSVLSLPLGTKYAAAASKEGTITATSLPLKKSSSRTSQTLTTLSKGTKVQIKSTKGTWMNIYVASKKKTGWVAKKSVSTTNASSVKTAAVSTSTYYVTTGSLNIRQSSTTSSKVVATVKKGESVTYYSKSGNWAKVKTASSVTGWASMTYLSKTKPVITKTYYVTANSLNVMASSSRASKVLTTIKKDASVTYYSKKNSWGKIKTTSGVTGWVANKDISTTKPKTAPTAETVSTGKFQYVTSDVLEIFEEANTEANILDVALKGDALTVTETNGDWGQVLTADGVVGWVNLSFLSNSAPINGLDGKVIVLDPGHGGKDPGAIGDTQKEKDLTLATAKRVKVKLEAAGAKVVMTRTGDTYPTLSDRVAFSKKNNADVFISIHINSGSSSATGIETYYWTTYKNEKNLASYVQSELIKSTGSDSRGIKTGNFQVIRENPDSAILVELGFISNPDEEALMATSDFQNDAATGFVNGLEAYFESL